ncbi:4-hydroxy-tetrahydrodipicolinate reductase [Flavobacteriaceae bacterium 14752]|uniref:4-hydroxy-tetrahydrodipicolinate reductase n=1 Tax=Mesohalobacter salilacus TaxID=2491711 RepID=UPI000F62D8B8|nr:4-hydroxy-tetrahydrodipicolinate reductase [Flavobacteriaceae bacterium 14752]
MKIALLGYGKMGQSIAKIAQERGHDIVYKTKDEPDFSQVKQADVAIEFSIPEAAFYNISECIKNQTPIISGTTGWLDQFDKTKNLAKQHQSKFLYASNFSVGVNLFFKLNKMLAEIMKSQQDYKVDISEIHHLEKKDAPSGTAISLAEQIIEYSDYKSWSHPPKSNESKDIPIKAYREKGIFGTHEISYRSEIDDIEIKHTAHSRKGFALGAVLAAEWLVNQDNHGCFSMSDVLNI